MRKLKKPLIALFVLGNLYAVLCGGLYFFQEQLLFHPGNLPLTYAYQFETPFEEVNLDGIDQSKLNGIHFKAENPKGVILYFHGNAGQLQRWGEITEFFVKLGYSVIVMDYRQYGKSTGSLSQEALYDDAQKWYAFAKAEYPTTPITAYGRSLGTTFATSVAANNEVKNVVLETPFYSIANEAKSRFPILPINALIKYEFPNYKYINDIKAPITFFHGTEDEVVAYEHGIRLFEYMKSEEKTFITVPGGGHNNLILYKEYTEAIEAALTR